MSSRHNPPLILVADDQVPTAAMLERVFEYEGYQVRSVYDGIAAVEAAQEDMPDLILLDINMPGMNGFEVLSKLRDQPKTASIPTILITAMGELANVVQGLNLGADDYLRKPFHPQELLARAESKMKARKLEESLQRRTQELEALLRVSEELSQHLDIDELLDFILYLVTDLLPCQMAAIYQLDESNEVADYRIQMKNGHAPDLEPDSRAIVDWVLQENNPTRWPGGGEALVPDFESGIVTPLQYGGQVRGALLIVNHDHYDENHLQLLNGISRQATLALHNAELYEIQADYALHLEDMVAERTEELESAQQMLVRAEKLASVGRLAASVAHEINNPLFPIQINLEGMVEDIENGEPVHADEVERTLESVERIRHIVNRLLEFTGNRQISSTDAQPLDVNALVSDITALNHKFFSQEGMSIETNLCSLPTVYGSKYQLEHVLMNLALNAKDAMQKGGVLRISTLKETDEVLIQFQDNGCGIPGEIIDNIFEPFFSTKENGNGLGLFISYGIMQSHNGTIEVESEVDEGTTITLHLPIGPPAEA